MVLIVTAISTTGFLAYVHNLNHSYQNHIQQITNTLEQQKTQQRIDAEKKLHDLEQKSTDQQKQIDDLQKQVSLKKSQQAALASSQAAQSVPVAHVASSGNCAAYEPLVAQYGWNTHVAMAVMQAESGCNATAANPTDHHETCNGSYGLFQIACMSGVVYDPAQNVAIAWQKYQARGWQPWGAYTSGAYLRYM